MEPETVLSYWCSPFGFINYAEVKETDVYIDNNPIIFIGGRGSGKTMFLKYFSFPVQFKEALNKNVSVLTHFKNKGGIGFYLRIDGPKLRSFSGAGIDDDKWLSIFTHYFELEIGRSYLVALDELIKLQILSKTVINDNFFKEINSLLGNTINKFLTISDVLIHIDDEMKKIDDFRSNIRFSNISFQPTKSFSSKSLSFNIPKIIKKNINEFIKDINFIIMIDEYENFLPSQQRLVNTMLKFVEPGVTFRLGMRSEGFRTFATTSEDDFIKEGRDYRKIIFEELLINNKDYQEFLKHIARKRLEQVKLLKEKDFLDITKILGKSENLEDEAIEITKKHPGKHFSLIKGISLKEKKLLEYNENPLLEMLNILWFQRGKKPKDIQKAMSEYLSAEETDVAKKYKNDYVNKYKLSLMFLLASIYKKNKIYYSFNTFSFLSSGIVGHFIELCRKSFQYAEFEDRDQLFGEGKISKLQQDKAAKDVAFTELQMIQRVEDHGSILYRFILNLGNLFRSYHKDKGIKYPETNQFSVDKGSIEGDYRKAFNSALKWSFIQRKPGLQQTAPGKRINDIYTINRIFSPQFEISYRTRGGYSVELSFTDIKEYMTENNVKFKSLSNEKNKKQNKNSEQQEFNF